MEESHTEAEFTNIICTVCIHCNCEVCTNNED